MMQLRIGVVGVIAAFVAVSLSLSAQAAEKKKLSGSSVHKSILSRTIVNPEDDPNHIVTSAVWLDSDTSEDSDFKGAEHFGYGYSDYVAGSGPDMGYTQMTLKNGEKIYGKFEGTTKRITKEGEAGESLLEGKWIWKGGTGKFKNINGTLTYKGKATPEGVSYAWEGEIEY